MGYQQGISVLHDSAKGRKLPVMLIHMSPYHSLSQSSFYYWVILGFAALHNNSQQLFEEHSSIWPDCYVIHRTVFVLPLRWGAECGGGDKQRFHSCGEAKVRPVWKEELLGPGPQESAHAQHCEREGWAGGLVLHTDRRQDDLHPPGAASLHP